MAADPGWQPLLTTVPEPDYPSGHGTLSGVAEAVLRKYDVTPLFLLLYVHQCGIGAMQYLNCMKLCM